MSDAINKAILEAQMIGAQMMRLEGVSALRRVGWGGFAAGWFTGLENMSNTDLAIMMVVGWIGGWILWAIILLRAIHRWARGL